MSKIFMTPMNTVTNTVTTVPQICGTTIRKNACTSVAPSIRAASMVSSGTFLMAAEISTMQYPTCNQIRMIISRKLFSRSVSICSHTCGSPPKTFTQIALNRPICSLPGGL